MGEIWNGLLGGLEATLSTFHDATEPLFGTFAWGWAIILLTFAVRLLLLPLAVKQIKSMRAMQQLQPQIKKIQKKYKVDRSLLRTDPEKYKEARAKQQEETMKLYKEHQVNPAAGCLPLILQMPVFFALFRVLQSPGESVAVLETAPWYGINSLGAVPSEGLAVAGIGAYLLIILMIGTTYLTQRQMMARNPGAEQNQQQKILLYVMPVMLAFFSYNLPVGVLIYWVATNGWTMVQQWFMFRNVEAAPAGAVSAAGPPPKDTKKRTRPSSDDQRNARGNGARRDTGSKNAGKGPQSNGSKKARGSHDTKRNGGSRRSGKSGRARPGSAESAGT